MMEIFIMYIREWSVRQEQARRRYKGSEDPRQRCLRLVEMSKVNLNYSIMVDKYSYAAPPIVLLFGKNYFFWRQSRGSSPTVSASIAARLCGAKHACA
jgi:hypothetical protein